jgi:hypothetical protein
MNKMYAVTDKREIARRVKNLKLRAVLLKNLVINLKKSTGIDMHEEILDYFRERLEDENK